MRRYCEFRYSESTKSAKANNNKKWCWKNIYNFALLVRRLIEESSRNTRNCRITLSIGFEWMKMAMLTTTTAIRSNDYSLFFCWFCFSIFNTFSISPSLFLPCPSCSFILFIGSFEKNTWYELIDVVSHCERRLARMERHKVHTERNSKRKKQRQIAVKNQNNSNGNDKTQKHILRHSRLVIVFLRRFASVLVSAVFTSNCARLVCHTHTHTRTHRADNVFGFRFILLQTVSQAQRMRNSAYILPTYSYQPANRPTAIRTMHYDYVRLLQYNERGPRFIDQSLHVNKSKKHTTYRPKSVGRRRRVTDTPSNGLMCAQWVRLQPQVTYIRLIDWSGAGRERDGDNVSLTIEISANCAQTNRREK